MNENDHQSEIKYYNEQLLVVEDLILICDPNDQTQLNELHALKTELVNLLSVCEASFLELKKRKLLDYIEKSEIAENHSESFVPSLETDVQNEFCTYKDFSKIALDEEFENMSTDIISTPEETYVLAPYNNGFGQSEYHSAFVIDKSYSNLNVSVVFSHPCSTEMEVCSYFLEGNCKYGLDCRNSHGFEIKYEDLKPFDLHLKEIKKNRVCLVKSNESESLWEKATIVDFYSNIVEVILHSNINGEPILFHKDSIWFYDTFNSHDEESFSNTINNKLTVSHENNFAAKFMQKMGYVPGKGLGKSLQGISEPIHIEKFPKKISIDKIFELKSRGINFNKNIVNFNKKVGKKKGNKNSQSDDTNNNILNRLNTALNKKKKESNTLISRRFDENEPNINIKLYGISEDIKDQKKLIKSIKNTISFKEINRVNTTDAQNKLNRATNELDEMIEQENKLKRTLKKMNTHKDMTF